MVSIRSFNSEVLGNFLLEYLRTLYCAEIDAIYEKFPERYKVDDIIYAKLFRCYEHWPTDSDISICSRLLRLNVTITF